MNPLHLSVYRLAANTMFGLRKSCVNWRCCACETIGSQQSTHLRWFVLYVLAVMREAYCLNSLCAGVGADACFSKWLLI